ncbi:MAG: phosphate acyltransferase PlsX [Oscillospiraceae bacterium]|nr:phosphate acyltransferase PlsX [Oscillospiraceae bacterium]MBQ9695877.1 phosphate acyltransferase PlsX [Oscillospiraceae bacterium]MBR1897703.1 phosphate acyltransferase PlsX [Oscillospiraceae bacterium]
MKIIIDAFGGDNAPAEVIKAARQAKDELGTDIVLVGDEERIRNCAASLGIPVGDMELLHAPDVFDIHAQPTTIVKEGKNTSLAVGLQALRDGRGDAFLSAGSSGGLVTGATLLTRRIKGIKRPAMTAMLPTAKEKFILLDAGANIECRPEMLVQFAVMGSAYMKCVKGIENPRVGLLNVGAEETKGRELELAAYELLQQAPVNFVGNAEARELPEGKYDVIVCDGFAGNMILKLYEGMGALFRDKLTDWFSGFAGKLAALLLLGKIKDFKRQMDYKEEGGGVILGAASPVIKAHGSSDAKAFFNAIRQAKRCVEGNMIGEIAKTVAEMKEEA